MFNKDIANHLILKWLQKVINNELNSEILFLFSLGKIKSKIIMEINTLLHRKNYKIRNLKDIRNLNSIKMNTNNIILCNPGEILIKALKSKYTVLLYNTKCFEELDIQQINKKLKNIIVSPKHKYLFYVSKEKADPVEIINWLINGDISDSDIIEKYYYYTLNNCLEITYRKHNTKELNISWEYTHINSLIIRDTNLLFNKKILTSRLAIIIYKISTLEFNHSNTKIGCYFSKRFNIHSKTTRINRIIKSHNEIVKAYHLKCSNTFNKLFEKN